MGREGLQQIIILGDSGSAGNPRQFLPLRLDDFGSLIINNTGPNGSPIDDGLLGSTFAINTKNGFANLSGLYGFDSANNLFRPVLVAADGTLLTQNSFNLPDVVLASSTTLDPGWFFLTDATAATIQSGSGKGVLFRLRLSAAVAIGQNFQVEIGFNNLVNPAGILRTFATFNGDGSTNDFTFILYPGITNDISDTSEQRLDGTIPYAFSIHLNNSSSLNVLEATYRILQ